jgi:DNA-binding NtrC family response regulator
MDRRIARPTSPLSIAAIPEMDTFDMTIFDALPIWGASTEAQLPPLILVVDDEPQVGRIIQRVLHEVRPQHEIIAVTHPRAAIEHLHGRRCALLITDFKMPDQNGMELTMAIKGHSPHTQVLLMTAYSTAILRRIAKHQGADFYLPKPFRLTDLEDLVNAALAAYDAHPG